MPKSFKISVESKAGLDMPESNIRSITYDIACKFPYLKIKRVKEVS